MKKCSICQLEKPLSEFNKNKRRKDGLQTICRSCNRERSRRYYAENTEKHKRVIYAQTQRYIKRNQDWVVQYLLENPCVDCSESDIVVLEFDHRGDKLGNVSQAICEPWSLERLQAEVQKCDVVCANCHRRRTAKELGYFKYLFTEGASFVGEALDF